jgi:exodeoxyribonuclease VII small subunit
MEGMQACRAVDCPASYFPIQLPNVSSKKPQTSDAADAQAPDFERSLAELEAIVEKLEQGDLSLDESLQHFERGVQLTRACQSALKQAEQKVEILLRRSGAPEQFEDAAFDTDDNERER